MVAIHFVEGGIRIHDDPKNHNGFYYTGQLLKAERIVIYPRYVFSAERVGILSAAYKSPQNSLKLHKLPELINLMIVLSKFMSSAAEIISLR